MKDLRAADLTFALAFPDTYEVGMSNLGFRLLYHALNDRPGVACERVFLPWPDLEAMLRGAEAAALHARVARAGARLRRARRHAAVRALRTSVLALLDLAGIPLLTRERGAEDPVVARRRAVRL